ncbi:MAG: hypothetical protein COB46_05915 [Rhodospirillaceae bacterium]|nr:MAG: hypothetical protein COB46_05915 [Rhodospirillaceae bacterium]
MTFVNTKLKHQRGAVLISIMVVMMVSMLTASTLVNHFGVSEHLEIERQLAEIRAHWAMRGAVTYARSRTRASDTTLCGGFCANDAARAAAVQTFFDEIPQPQNWYKSGAYGFDVTYTVAETDTSENGHVQVDVSTTPSAAGLAKYLALEDFTKQRLQVELCFYQTSCNDGSTGGGGGAVASGDGKTDITLFHIPY